jgi:hypothetical protein
MKMAKEWDYKFTPKDTDFLNKLGFAENGGEDNETVKMTIQSAINRLRSGRKKEFGSNFEEIGKKGYYAVKNNSPLWQEANSGKFKDDTSKRRFEEIKTLTNAIIKDKDYGEAMFYFKPEEEEKMRKDKSFDFNKVRPVSKVGKYNTYSY